MARFLPEESDRGQKEAPKVHGFLPEERPRERQQVSLGPSNFFSTFSSLFSPPLFLEFTRGSGCIMCIRQRRLCSRKPTFQTCIVFREVTEGREVPGQAVFLYL